MKKQMVRKSALIAAVVVVFLPLRSLSQEPERRHNRERRQTLLLFKVTAGDPENPVRGAEIRVRTQSEDDEFDGRATTNRDGVARLSKVPRGKVLIIVTAEGCGSVRVEFDLKQESQTIPVKLERLPEQ